MKRLLPAPLLTLSLFTLWLVLNQSLSPGHVLLALLLSVLLPAMTAQLRPAPVHIRHPMIIVRLFFIVGMDVVTSSIEVAWGVWRSPWRMPNGAFVRIPLELRDPNALAALAAITTAVPGTVWSELSLDRRFVLLHIFDLHDEAAFVARYKGRYERPLQEIFE